MSKSGKRIYDVNSHVHKTKPGLVRNKFPNNYTTFSPEKQGLFYDFRPHKPKKSGHVRAKISFRHCGELLCYYEFKRLHFTFCQQLDQVESRVQRTGLD